MRGPMEERMADIKYFTQIPAWVDELEDVSDFQVRLLGFIYTLENTVGSAFPSNGFLAKKYRKKENSVQKALSDLYKKGYVTSKVKYKNGTSEVEKRYLTLNQPRDLNHKGGGLKSTTLVETNHRGSGLKSTDSKSFSKSMSISIPPTPKGDEMGENDFSNQNQIDSELHNETKGSEATLLATREAKEESIDLNLKMLRYARLAFGKSEIEVPDTTKGMFSGIVNRNIDFQSFIDVTNYLATKWTPEFIATKPVIAYLVNMSKWDARENEARSAGFINSKSVVDKQAAVENEQGKRAREHDLQSLANERYPIIKRLYIEKYGREKMPLPSLHMPAFDNLSAWEKLVSGDEKTLAHLHEIVEAED